MTTFTPFDVADHLDDEETISAYLSEALADPDPAMFLLAIKDVARVRGMTHSLKILD
jgi:probable addiction module antidote protein